MRVIGLDPGETTGVAVLDGSLNWKLSDDRWGVQVSQIEISELFKEGQEYVEEGALVSSLPLDEAFKWWSSTAVAGVGLAMRVLDLFGGNDGVVVMEDYVLSPTGGAAGIGGRSAVVPVLLGGAFVAQLSGVWSGELMFSSPSAKAVMTNQRLRRWFGDVGRGVPHGVDALRHACLAVRRVRKGI